jgi:N-acetylglutamate synthase-like GNAT family acetyltransferase
MTELQNTSDALQFDLLKLEERSDLIIAIKKIMLEGDAHNLQNFDEQYWQWQYQNLPTSKANIYVARNAQNEILAYYHVPMYDGVMQNQKVQFGMIQDVAVSDTLRGRGVFRQLAEFANAHLNQQGLGCIYTFPNTKSIHTFIKYNGFADIATLPAYILPLNTAQIIKSKLNIPFISDAIGAAADLFLLLIKQNANNLSVQTHETFSNELEHVFTQYQQTFSFGLVKSNTYLNWRFVQKSKHFIFSINDTQTNKIVAVAVFKKDLIMRMNCLVLMDFACIPSYEKSLQQLISNVAKHHLQLCKEKFALLFTSCNTAFNNHLKQIGFFKIPDSKNPRPLHLLVRPVAMQHKI